MSLAADTATVTEYYEADHDTLDGYFMAFHVLKRTNWMNAKESFEAFRVGLQRHILWEEQILFPFWERKTGLWDMGPTTVMRTDHRQIRNLLDSIHAKVQQDDPNSEAEEQELLVVLSAHNTKEERVLYPAIDQMATEEERRRIFMDMASLPKEWFASCCETEHA